MKFHENSSSGSRVVPYGLTDGRIDMTKLLVTFHNFENKPKHGSEPLPSTSTPPFFDTL